MIWHTIECVINRDAMFVPLYFKTRQMPCLIVGGGQVAARKIEMLLAAGCLLTVVAPAIDDSIRKAVDAGVLNWRARAYAAGDCEGFQLVVAATPHEGVNRAVSLEARRLGIPVNVVDAPELCTVMFAAVWRDGPLTISVSSGGAAPFMAAEIRDRISRVVDGMGAWVEAAGKFRAAVRSEVADPAERDRLYRLFAARTHFLLPENLPESQALADWLKWLNLSGPSE
jgi:uroporphyrin-III C-methyltransferase/precorrin-2 dehydrogenase/sirohydrochlorin ferrochelatase